MSKHKSQIKPWLSSNLYWFIHFQRSRSPSTGYLFSFKNRHRQFNMASFNAFALRITLLIISFLTLGSFAAKRGLVYKAGTHDLIQNWNGQGSQINWAYNWDSAIEGEFPQYMEYNPMLCGPPLVQTAK